MGRQHRTVRASEFKAKCLQLMDEVNQTHRGIIVTKFGKAVAKLEPINEVMNLFGCAKNQISYANDLYSTGEQWDAEDE